MPKGPKPGRDVEEPGATGSIFQPFESFKCVLCIYIYIARVRIRELFISFIKNGYEAVKLCKL